MFEILAIVACFVCCLAVVCLDGVWVGCNSVDLFTSGFALNYRFISLLVLVVCIVVILFGLIGLCLFGLLLLIVVFFWVVC